MGNSPLVTSIPTDFNDGLGFFEGVCLAELEQTWFRLSYAEQRRLFGKLVFGKKQIKVGTEGTVIVYRTCAFGRDWDEQNWTWNQELKSFCYSSDLSRPII